MKILIAFILVFLFASCTGIDTGSGVEMAAAKAPRRIDSTYIVWDTVHKPWCCIIDTTHKDSIVIVKVPKPVDSPYTVARPVPIDSFYKVPIPVDSPYYVPRAIPVDSFYTVPRPVPVDSPYHVPRIIYDDSIIHRDTIIYNYIQHKAEYGLLQAKYSDSAFEARLNKANLKIVRLAVYFKSNYFSKTINKFLADGFKVHINFNYMPTDTPVVFPTDTNFIKTQAENFFKYYLPFKDQIPFVAVENEWDNPFYRNWKKTRIEDYITELAIVARIGNKYGFKITDAGITGNNLGRWTYSKLSGTVAAQWRGQHFVGLELGYDSVVQFINKYAQQVKGLPLYFINLHWYNENKCAGNFILALNAYLLATGFDRYVLNEWGVKDSALWQCTITEMKSVNPFYSIAYSGINEPNKAIELSDNELKLITQ
jgi:hypothetical protein